MKFHIYHNCHIMLTGKIMCFLCLNFSTEKIMICHGCVTNMKKNIDNYHYQKLDECEKCKNRGFCKEITLCYDCLLKISPKEIVYITRDEPLDHEKMKLIEILKKMEKIYDIIIRLK